MNIRLLICLQLLAIAFSLTTSSSQSTATDEPVFLRLGAFPQAFDLRTIYYNCEFAIYDEGVCAGNWAIAIADTISDILCITNGTQAVLSAQQILDCVDQSALTCKNSTSDSLATDSLNFTIANGLTTSECYPYTSKFTGNPGPRCSGLCANEATITEIYKVSSYVPLNGVEDTKSFIIENGSVLAVIKLYSDFLLYNSGIYARGPNARYFGYHSVKIVGWDVDANGNEYWIAANSWSINWGMGGYFNFGTTSDLWVQGYGVAV